MNRLGFNRLARLAAFVLAAATMLGAGGCSTAPKVQDRATFARDADSATSWFENNVFGLSEQIDDSAGYIIFPTVNQWGIGIGGGEYGRGMLNRPDDSQIGWAAINTTSIGLQAGIQGFKMLIVLEDASTLEQFKNNQLAGTVAGSVLVGERGGGSKASFENGVAIYQGANAGLMAGVSIGLDYVRYEPLDEM